MRSSYDYPKTDSPAVEGSQPRPPPPPRLRPRKGKPETALIQQPHGVAAIGPSLKYVGDMNALRRGTYWNRL